MRGNFLAIVLGGALSLLSGPVAAATCPVELEPLTSKLLEDLPGYANRVIRRTRGDRTELRARHVVIAGRPEFEPLPAGSQEYQPAFPASRQAIEQIFFTTLEQQYAETERQTTQNFHWLLLAQTPERGWDLVAMFSRLGTLDPEDPPGAIRESTGSAIANGIRLWLRDCEAGTLR